jgi:hypothetical protein
MKTESIDKLLEKWRREADELRKIADYPSCNPIERAAYRGGAARIERMVQELVIAKDK